METNGLLEHALVYLAAGIIAVPIFKRLGLGSVLGYLIAGVAIGPWGMRLVSEPGTLLQIAELGVVLLLFLVGLELNVQKVWTLRRAIFGLGGVQVVLTIAAVALLGLAFKIPLVVGVIAGMGFAMSSTAIGLQTLSEKNLLNTPGGQASFAVLLFQDLAVVPLLIVLRFLTESKHGLDWLKAAEAVGIVVLLIFAGRFLVRPVMRFVAETRLREVFVAFSLLVVLGAAALMEWVGLSMALGAFLAGVMLADSEYRHELELDIEPFKGLLLGLFFMAVGMSIDLSVFLSAPLIVLGLAVALVVLKMIVLYPIAQGFGYCNRADAGLFAVALSQGGEFAFVLFNVSSGLLEPGVVAVLNAAVAASMLTTPFLIMGYERFLMRNPKARADRAPDAIEEANPVIVAGFGRFGQVVVRVLRGLGIGATVVDIDPGQIETVRRFGFKTYYGDATRLDLLESAGAGKAKVLLMAIDDSAAAMAAVKRIRERFPDLRIIARARGRTDAYEYAELGVPAVREVFGSALDAAFRMLQALGYDEERARRVIRRFREYDESQLVANARHRGDITKLIALGEQGRRDIAALLAAEAQSAPEIDRAA